MMANWKFAWRAIRQRPGRSILTLLSIVIVVHFAAIGVNILSEPSGPWPSLDGMGVGLAEPPMFITEGITETARNYVQGLRVAETGRYPSIRLQPLQVHLEAILYDKDGNALDIQSTKL